MTDSAIFFCADRATVGGEAPEKFSGFYFNSGLGEHLLIAL